MPFFDRHWWLRALLALLFLAAGIAYAIGTYFLTSWITNDSSLDASTSWWLMILTPIVFALGMTLGASSLVHSAFAARRRSRDRRAAIDGELERLPLISMRVDASQAVDLTQRPLTLSWRWSRRRRLWLVIVMTVYGAAVLAFPFLLLFPAVSELSPLFSSDPDLPFLLASPFGFLGVFCFLFACVTFLHGIRTRHRPGRPRIMFAEDGIEAVTRFGQRRTLRWDEARLLEVRFAPFPFRQYILYGPRGRFVRWIDYLPSGSSSFLQRSALAPDGISEDEMAERLRSALATIAARTGLIPRTLDPRLQPQAPASGQGRLGRIGMVFATVVAIVLLAPFGLALLGLPLGLGVYVVVQQPFADPVLTMICGAMLISAGALAIMWPLKAILAAQIYRRTVPEQPIAQPMATEASAHDRVYELVLPQSWFDAILTLLIPVLLLSGGAVGVLAWFMTPRSDGGDLPTLLDTSLVVSLIGLFGVMGAGLLVIRLRAGLRSIKRIRVERDGLHLLHWNHTVDLPWERVDALRVIMLRDGPLHYSVAGDIGRTTIDWSAHARSARPAVNMLPLTPAALASLIEHRSGIKRVRMDMLGRRIDPEPLR